MTKEKEWGQDSIKDVKLTKNEVSELYDEVIEVGRTRNKNMGIFNEIDYLCGAMAVFHALNIPCPTWPISIMCGKSLLDK